MVHNGIEYAEMQLIAEIYGLFRYGYGYTPDEISDLFEQWQHDLHRSYLLEITIDILRRKEGHEHLLDIISDAAKSKGTGSWVLQAATALGLPSPVISAALHARFLSGIRNDRLHAMQLYNTTGAEAPQTNHIGQEQLALYADAFYLARIINHHLGFDLLHQASNEYQWNLDLREIARVWTNGCIIRSSFMERIAEDLKPGIPLLLHEMIISGVESRQKALVEMIAKGIALNIALPCHSAALNFLLGYIRTQPTGNLIQAQRDYFGSHGFERLDDPSGRVYHLE
jgi:6-phosphogluconate dehydrogenase